jgi:hypothetical protein
MAPESVFKPSQTFSKMPYNLPVGTFIEFSMPLPYVSMSGAYYRRLIVVFPAPEKPFYNRFSTD